MALGSSLALSPDPAQDVDTNTDSYVLRAGDLGKSEYSVQGLTLPVARVLRVSHEIGKGGEERHLIRIDRTEVDANLVPATVSVYINVIRPPSTAITLSIVTNTINQLVDFLCESNNANVTKFLNNEV